MTSFNKADIDYASLKQAASHYKGEKNYCSVIALAIATGCKFGKARSILAREINRKTGQGTYRHLIHPVYTKLGKQVIQVFTRKGFMIKNAASNLPSTGTYLVYSSGHVTCLKDGVIHDWCIEVAPEGFKTKGKRMQEVYQVV